MATEYVDWFSQPDPRPDALPNIRKAAAYMVERGATYPDAAISVYSIAKYLGRNNTQISNLIKLRPGFVRVENAQGELGGYYYDVQNFTATYPSSYQSLRGKRVKTIDSLARSNVEAAQTINKQFNAAAEQLSRDLKKPAKPDFIFPTFTGTETIDRTARFSLLPNEIAKDLIQTSAKALVEDGLNEDALVDMATALFSLLAHTKQEKDNGLS